MTLPEKKNNKKVQVQPDINNTACHTVTDHYGTLVLEYPLQVLLNTVSTSLRSQNECARQILFSECRLKQYFCFAKIVLF
jgi:hypothetical protein